MISETAPYFSNDTHGFQIYEGAVEMLSSSRASASSVDTFSNTLLYNLSILKDRVEQARTLVSAVFSEDHIPQESKAMAITGMGSLTQHIIGAASSMMPAFQQLNPQATVSSRSTCELQQHHMKASHDCSSQPSAQAMDHVLALEEGRTSMPSGGSHYFSNTGDLIVSVTTGDEQHDRSKDHMMVGSKELQDFSSTACDILELDAGDLLAQYTHYCQVCGKGFKRGANLRMHMRAHGDEYKTNKALSNPMKDSGGGAVHGRRYSCPEKGCRWNKRDPKFQPLKSLLCVKNHYMRSHCPKIYVCIRCNCKQFSVLSDLRKHENHCGDLKWQCTCGTTFSRKDKLMGHLFLFAGHAPAPSCFEKGGKSQTF